MEVGERKKPSSVLTDDGLKLLCEMFVVKDMVLTIAVISGTAGTVPEFQIRKLGVCTAADRALVPVPLRGLFLLLLAGGSFEVDGFG